MNSLALNDPTGLEDPKNREAAAHMSLHLKPTMSKSAKYRRLAQPFLSRGEPSAENLVTVEADRLGHRCGDTPLGRAFDSVKPFFAIFFQLGVKTTSSAACVR